MIAIESKRLHPILSIYTIEFKGGAVELVSLLEKLKIAGFWDKSLKESLDFNKIQQAIFNMKQGV